MVGGNLAVWASLLGTPYAPKARDKIVFLEDVSEASLELTPPATVPVFRYYAYSNGSISPTPLPVPLSADDSKLVVQVTVAFSASPGADAEAIDEDASIELVDSVLVRFSPSNEDTNKAGLPCT